MYLDPCTVLRQVGPVNYMLQRTKKSKSFMSHVDKLKPCLTTTFSEEGGEKMEAEDSTQRENEFQRPRRAVGKPDRYAYNSATDVIDFNRLRNCVNRGT